MTERTTDAAQLAAQKRELRQRMRALRSSLPPSVVARRSQEAAERLLALSLPAGASVVALYMGLPSEGELDASFADHALRERGITTVYPRVVSRRPPVLAFCAVDNLGDLGTGSMGVREPHGDAPPVAPSAIDAFVVPGLAFDHDGGRLGFGAAFYDATLAQQSHALRIGYCHPEQVVAHVPCDVHDQRVDALITPENTASFVVRRGASIPGEA